MNITEIENAVRDWVIANMHESVEGVIIANQNAPRPKRPYITIFVSSTVQKEHSNVGAPNGSGVARIENETACMVSLQAFGVGAKTILYDLRGSLEKVTVLQSLRSSGIPFIRVLNGVTDITEVVGTQYEERASMDLEFRAVASVTDDLGVIESVSGTATHERGSNSSTTLNYEIGA
jgi:hypothetical protein